MIDLVTNEIQYAIISPNSLLCLSINNTRIVFGSEGKNPKANDIKKIKYKQNYLEIYIFFNYLIFISMSQKNK